MNRQRASVALRSGLQPYAVAGSRVSLKTSRGGFAPGRPAPGSAGPKGAASSRKSHQLEQSGGEARECRRARGPRRPTARGAPPAAAEPKGSRDRAGCRAPSLRARPASRRDPPRPRRRVRRRSRAARAGGGRSASPCRRSRRRTGARWTVRPNLPEAGRERGGRSSGSTRSRDGPAASTPPTPGPRPSRRAHRARGSPARRRSRRPSDRRRSGIPRSRPKRRSRTREETNAAVVYPCLASASASEGASAARAPTPLSRTPCAAGSNPVRRLQCAGKVSGAGVTALA